MPTVLASLRSADCTNLDRELAALESAGVDLLHLDIMDGKFCDEVSFPLGLVRQIREQTSLPLDAHLMVERPEEVLDDWIGTGVERISFHLEACGNPGPALARIREAGLIPGLVILPGTNIEALDPWLDEVRLVNPLGVNPVEKTGFDEATYERIQFLKRRKTDRNLDFVIQADGGVWEKTRDRLVESGADELVGGFPIFSKNDYSVAVSELRNG